MKTIYNNDHASFLKWLSNRLRFKYKEDNSISDRINLIVDNYKICPKNIPVSIIDRLCKKYYPDFDCDKTPEMNIGYTQQERLQIKQFIVSIIEEVSSL